MAHREGIRDYLKNVQVHGLVYDWGCGTKPIKNYLPPNDARFFGIDFLGHVGADLVRDIEQPVVMPAQADFAFCLEVIEHTWNVVAVIENIFDNLKPGGRLYLSQPFLYEVHKEDDVHRYTHHGLRRLLKDAGFATQKIYPTGGTLNTAWGYVAEAIK